MKPLKDLAVNSTSPLARVMALYSLQGLSALDADLVMRTLNSPDPAARQHALRLAESFADQAEVQDAVLPLASDSELRVRYQAAFSLGAFAGGAVTQQLKQIAVKDGADPWMQLAVLSSLGHRRVEFFTALVSDGKARSITHVHSMILALASQSGAANAKQELTVFLKEVDLLPADEKTLAADLVKTVIAVRPAIRNLLGDDADGRIKTILSGLIRDAQAAAGDDGKNPAERASAVRTLAAAKFADVEELFGSLLASQQPQPVQAAALETLARFDSPNIPKLIQQAWPSLTPQLRAAALETWFTRPSWIAVFLDAVESEAVARTDVDPARIALLQKSENKELRDRTAKLFDGAALARRQDVVDAYQKSLELPGNMDKGRIVFRKTCAACHKLEGFGESIGADLNAIRDRGIAAVMLNNLDPNREVKPQFQAYVIVLEDGVTITGMIQSETANSLTIRKADGTSQSILRVKIEELKSTNLSFMPEGLEKQIDVPAMADLLAYLNSIK